MAARNPSQPGRRAMRIVGAVMVILAAGMLGVYWLYGCRVHLRAAGGGGFSRVVDFPLRDSLPALEGGLSNLEAFKSTISPSWRADADRVLWVSDSLGTVHVEYLAEKNPFDSVLLLSWTTGGTLASRVFRTPVAAWHQKVERPVSDWAEVVTAYVSFPPLISFRSADSTVSLFEPAEGKVSHVVARWYLDRQEKPLSPDTAYLLPGPEPGAEPGTGMEIQLVVRGDALAIINPSPRVVALRILDSGGKDSTVVQGKPAHVTVFREVMRGRRPPVLAYSDPGVTFPVFQVRDIMPRQMFIWLGDNGVGNH